MLNVLCLVAGLLPLVGGSEPIVVGEKLVLSSKVMEEDRTVLVVLPADYESSRISYPVLYVTDGPSHVNHTAATVAFLADNKMMPEMIVVGVAKTDRTRDLTPLPKKLDERSSGGADRFLDFFEKELFPEIDKRYRTQPFRVFAGHS